MDAIKDMLKSKKFHAAFFGVLALVFSALSGNVEWSEAIEKGWALILAYIGAQGLADIGKEKAKVETTPAPVETPATLSVEEAK